MKAENEKVKQCQQIRFVKGTEYLIYKTGIVTEDELFTHIHVYFNLEMGNKDFIQSSLQQIQEFTTLRIVQYDRNDYLYTYYSQTHSQQEFVIVFENTLFGKISIDEQQKQLTKLYEAVQNLQTMLEEKQNNEYHIDMTQIYNEEKDIFRDFIIV